MITSKSALCAVIASLAGKVTPAKTKKLSRKVRGVDGGTAADTTLDFFYVQYINDVLRDIRGGETAYIYNASQIKDVMRFEPKAKFDFADGAVCVSL